MNTDVYVSHSCVGFDKTFDIGQDKTNNIKRSRQWSVSQLVTFSLLATDAVAKEQCFEQIPFFHAQHMPTYFTIDLTVMRLLTLELV